MAAISTTDAPARAPEQRFAYDGRLGELYGIFFVNLLLTVLTFGIYRFWGKTRIRHPGFDAAAWESIRAICGGKQPGPATREEPSGSSSAVGQPPQ